MKEERNALVKLRLCHTCSLLLNYKKQNKKISSPKQEEIQLWDEYRNQTNTATTTATASNSIRKKTNKNSEQNDNNNKNNTTFQQKRTVQQRSHDDADNDDDTEEGSNKHDNNSNSDSDTANSAQTEKESTAESKRAGNKEKRVKLDENTGAVVSLDKPTASAATHQDIWNKPVVLETDLEDQKKAEAIDTYMNEMFQ